MAKFFLGDDWLDSDTLKNDTLNNDLPNKHIPDYTVPVKDVPVNDEQEWAKIKGSYPDRKVDYSDTYKEDAGLSSCVTSTSSASSVSTNSGQLEYDFRSLVRGYRKSSTPLFTTMDEFEREGLRKVPREGLKTGKFCSICQLPLLSPSSLDHLLPLKVSVTITIEKPDLIELAPPLTTEDAQTHRAHFPDPYEATEITHCKHAFHRMCLNKRLYNKKYIQETRWPDAEHILSSRRLYPATLTDWVLAVPTYEDMSTFDNNPISYNTCGDDRRLVLYSMRLFYQNLVFSGHLTVMKDGRVELTKDGPDFLQKCSLSKFQRQLDPKNRTIVRRLDQLYSAWIYFHETARNSHHNGDLHLLKGMRMDWPLMR